MLIFAALCFLIGIALGLRFKVLVLVPVAIVFLAIVAGISSTLGYSSSDALIAICETTATLQLGYLIGAQFGLPLRRPLGKNWATAPSLGSQ